MPSEVARGHWMARLGLAGALLLTAPLHAQGDVAAAATPASAPTPASSVSSASAAGSAPGTTAVGGSIDSVERADQVIRDVSRQRAAVAARFTKDQQECASVFLMTRCLDAAREQRREALAKLRGPEIEANAFKRRARVIERDQALEEKRLKSEQQVSTEQRGVTIREPGKAGGPADGQAKTEGLPRTAKSPMVVRPERDTPQHKPKPLSAPISAATQASNIASFDRKAAESAERQRMIAEKKAEKERDRAAKKARAAAQQPAP